MALSSFQRSPSIGTNFVKIRTNNLYCTVLTSHTCWPRESPIKTRSESVLSGVLSRSQKMFSLLLLPSAALAWAPAPGLVLSSIFFSIWGKVVSSFKHFTLMEECQTIMSSHLLGLSFLLVLINPIVLSWLTIIWSWSWMNKFLWNPHMQGSFLRFTRVKQMSWNEILFWELDTLICHQNHTRIKP